MANSTKINVYLDFEFLKLLFTDAKRNSFDEKAKLINSFIDFINKSYVNLFFADNGLKINKYDLFRVFMSSDIRSFRDLVCTENYKYNNIDAVKELKSNFIFFFGEKYDNPKNIIKETGILFSNYQDFISNWKLLSEKKTIHILSTENQSKINNFWKNILKNILKIQNYILFIEPFLSGWDLGQRQIERNGENIIFDNFISIINEILSEEMINTELTVLSKINENRANLLQQKKDNISNIENMIKDNFVNIDYKILFFNEKADVRNFLKEKIRNYLHDRYIYTNYYQIYSAHSWDYVQEKDGRKYIQKNSQITISSIINEETFNFINSKFENYDELIKLAKQNNKILTKRETDNFSNRIFNNN